jgi:hypothetical protein
LGDDEAFYDSTFTTPGVTFVASTGDYGAANPEYPAFSPNVVAVGGTSLNLNADNSYNSETGWGSYSASQGTLIASGGGISLYEPEPAFQQGVQATGNRTTPDVSFVADPATGAWIADPYNLPASSPFEVVGGTSLSAPAWAGLFALVDQGRVAAGGKALNSASPTEAQQSLYSLSQADYNVIAGGSNGYSAAPGYNLVTGLGTPMANLLVPDLVAGNFPATGRVAAAGAEQMVDTGTSATTAASITNTINVFDALLLGADGVHWAGYPGLAAARGHGVATTWDLVAPASANPAQAGVAARDLLFADLAGDYQGGSGLVGGPLTSFARTAEVSSAARGTVGGQPSQPLFNSWRVEDGGKQALDLGQGLMDGNAAWGEGPRPSANETSESLSAPGRLDPVENSSRVSGNDQRAFGNAGSALARRSPISRLRAQLSDACFAEDGLTSAVAMVGLALLLQDSREREKAEAGARSPAWAPCRAPCTHGRGRRHMWTS